MISTILGLAADLFGKLIAPILGFLTSWRAERTARDLGRAEQGRADAVAGLTEARNAQTARAEVRGLDSDAIDDELRNPATRTGRK